MGTSFRFELPRERIGIFSRLLFESVFTSLDAKVHMQAMHWIHFQGIERYLKQA